MLWCWELEGPGFLVWDPAHNMDSEVLVSFPPPNLTGKTEKPNQVDGVVTSTSASQRAS